ncbi:MAG TPA: rRNA adenine N-6-methyltransferase family protein, partial [Candidatus Absconditabacterales bacterium]|nr:rRNA adenine N-6-methyltransferase family protein [Candidatus Absconditabacterales bacterium]
MSTYLGQNFLVDTKVKSYIAEKIRQIYEDNNLKCIIEIGPGKGAITKKIHNISNNFFVIEKDETMKDHLEGILDKEQIIFVDVLKSNIEKELEKRNIDPKKTLV